MMFNHKKLNTGLFLLRATVGGLLLLHGLRKLENPKKTQDKMAKTLAKNNLPTVMANGVFMGEVVAPLAVLLGYKTRLFAPIITFNMLTAIYTVNMDKINKRDKTGAWGLEVQAFYLMGGVILFFTGGGKYAISHNSTWD